MPPIWLFIIIGIALLIVLFLSLKINLVLIYEDDFSAYLKILFIKIKLYPEKSKKIKKNKPKEPVPDNIPAKSTSPKEKEKADIAQILKFLNDMKKILADLISCFLGKLHFKFVKIYVSIGCDDASKTALAYGTVSQGIAYIVELLDNISNVDVSSSSDIQIIPNFISQKCEIECKTILYLRIISILKIGFKAIKAYFAYKDKKEKLTEVKNNGTVKTK